jgi:hypothetical protein
VYKIKNPLKGIGGNKKWQVTYIAPLQPPTLAAFPPWGSSAGAGRARPAGAKIGEMKKVCRMKNEGINFSFS